MTRHASIRVATVVALAIASPMMFVPPASAGPLDWLFPGGGTGGGTAGPASVTPTVAKTINTAAWTPTSPDPSGIAYMPGPDRLLIGDGEVDEMPLYVGSNIYTATRQGALVGTGTSLPWSNEPVGVGFNPATGMAYISDDDKKKG